MLPKMREVIWEAFLEQNRSMTIFSIYLKDGFAKSIFP